MGNGKTRAIVAAGLLGIAPAAPVVVAQETPRTAETEDGLRHGEIEHTCGAREIAINGRAHRLAADVAIRVQGSGENLPAEALQAGMPVRYRIAETPATDDAAAAEARRPPPLPVITEIRILPR